MLSDFVISFMISKPQDQFIVQIPMKQLIKKNTKSSYQNLNKFNFRSSPIPSLNLPASINILSLQISENGSSGVIFVQIEQGSFVIKPSYNTPFQLFYNKVAGQVGMRVPHMKFFALEDRIHNILLKGMQEYCKGKDQILLHRIRTKFSQLFYAMIQYIPFIGFQSVGRQRITKMLLQPQRLNAIGVCLGFDIMINNNDRFRLLWMGQGNIQNVLINIPAFGQHSQSQIRQRNNIDIQLGQYIFIDQTGNIFDSNNADYQKQLKLYLQKIIQFVKQAVNFLLDYKNKCPSSTKFMQNSFIDSFLDHVQLYTTYRLQEQELYQIVLGVIDGIEAFLSKYKNNTILNLLQNTKQLSKSIKFKADLWLKQLNKINIEDYNTFQKQMRPILRSYRKNQKISTNNQNQHKATDIKQP